MLRKQRRRLTAEVEELQAVLQDTAVRAVRGDRSASQLRLILELNERLRERLAALPALFDERQIQAHVSQAIGAAELRSEPFEHIVVEQVPPAAVSEKFHQPLQGHYNTIFGSPFRARANALPQLSSGGRLVRRRPGYHLAPHRDPKRSMLTCLRYLAHHGDDEAHGTRLFRVTNDREASNKQMYSPGADGCKCELATLVPFRPNTMLVFLNSRGAHGATIPADAGDDLERYAYQFYMAPDNAALGALIRELPPDRRTML